jgi:Uma2 family endonuclease
MATVASVLSEIEYPESDGEPMGETPIHRNQIAYVIDMLEDHYAADPDVYVSGNMMMYYVEGNPRKSVSPDVFVTLGIPKRPERRTYRTWVEGKGPDLTIEMHSRGTWRADVGWKLDLYRDVLKVLEYFLFDPLEERPGVKALRGFRLIDGAYEPIPEIDGRLVSEVLGLHLEAAGEELRLYDPRRGVYLRPPREVREALAREEAARGAAEVRAEWEAAGRAAADARADREATARAAAQAQADREAVARAASDAKAQQEEAARVQAQAQADSEAAARAAADAKAEQEATARAASDAKAQEESTARAAAEAEVERLCREIEDLRRARPAGS